VTLLGSPTDGGIRGEKNKVEAGVALGAIHFKQLSEELV